MKSGLCPKCQSPTVFHQPGEPTQVEQLTITNGAVVKRTTAPDRYVCASCGYTEFYVTNEDDLERIWQNWEQVPAAV
ncbi:MAG TPA: hypothetical protein VK610_02765 [Rhodothermales bacterium]|nr:hypothetical protein [Rhodothermales bacterium]